MYVFKNVDSNSAGAENNQYWQLAFQNGWQVVILCG